MRFFAATALLAAAFLAAAFLAAAFLAAAFLAALRLFVKSSWNFPDTFSNAFLVESSARVRLSNSFTNFSAAL